MTSNLAFIPVKSANPFELLNEWMQILVSHGYSELNRRTMCLATASLTGGVSNRNVLVKEFSEDGFLFATDSRGRKAQELGKNNKVAATFMWLYNQNDDIIINQVRVEGEMEKMSTEIANKFFESEDLLAKIRSHICNQGKAIVWEDLKKRHDSLLKNVLEGGQVLSRPEHYCVYKLVPNNFDFYFSKANHISDRVVFSKHESFWTFSHVAA